VHFDSPVKNDLKRSVNEARDTHATGPKTGVQYIKMNGADPESTIAADSLVNCSTLTTPDCLRALYNIPNGQYDKSSYGIVEYTANVMFPTAP
jgi:hypothetical protein